jgi:predicted nuclease with TOPRIM domain
MWNNKKNQEIMSLEQDKKNLEARLSEKTEKINRIAELNQKVYDLERQVCELENKLNPPKVFKFEVSQLNAHTFVRANHYRSGDGGYCFYRDGQEVALFHNVLSIARIEE